MVTLPMNKEATQLSDPTFTGHTELIGEICGAADVTIMLVSDDLIVTHVSTHCSLREAIERAHDRSGGADHRAHVGGGRSVAPGTSRCGRRIESARR